MSILIFKKTTAVRKNEDDATCSSDSNIFSSFMVLNVFSSDTCVITEKSV